LKSFPQATENFDDKFNKKNGAGRKSTSGKMQVIRCDT